MQSMLHDTIKQTSATTITPKAQIAADLTASSHGV
jgi:hypothetical protein